MKASIPMAHSVIMAGAATATAVGVMGGGWGWGEDETPLDVDNYGSWWRELAMWGRRCFSRFRVHCSYQTEGILHFLEVFHMHHPQSLLL